MELNEFVSTTLLEIMDGVAKAQRRYPPHADPNVAPTAGSINARWFNREPIRVAFDVAVEAVSAEGGRAGIRIAAFGVELGASERAPTATVTNSNRIRFEVPVLFPFSGEAASAGASSTGRVVET